MRSPESVVKLKTQVALDVSSKMLDIHVYIDGKAFSASHG